MTTYNLLMYYWTRLNWERRKLLVVFLTRLRHEMEMMVRMFHLKPLQEAYSLAKLKETVKNGPTSHGQVGESGIYNMNQRSSILP